MRLTTTNLLKTLKTLSPCPEGMRDLRRLLKKNQTQKRSLKHVFEQMQELEKTKGSFNIGWMYETLDDGHYVEDSSKVSFAEFKKSFENFKTYAEKLEQELEQERE